MVRARVLLHMIVGIQILLGLTALWARIQSADDPQPMPFMVISTVVHTVVGRDSFCRFPCLTVLLCVPPRSQKQGSALATTRAKCPLNEHGPGPRNSRNPAS